MEDQNDFFESLRKFMSEYGGTEDGSSQNPEEYARKVRIDDPELQLKFMEMSHKHKRWERLRHECEAAKHDFKSASTKMYLALEDRYPDIPPPHENMNGGIGIKKWKGEYWFVGWDGASEDEKNER